MLRLNFPKRCAGCGIWMCEGAQWSWPLLSPIMIWSSSSTLTSEVYCCAHVKTSDFMPSGSTRYAKTGFNGKFHFSPWVYNLTSITAAHLSNQTEVWSPPTVVKLLWMRDVKKVSGNLLIWNSQAKSISYCIRFLLSIYRGLGNIHFSCVIGTAYLERFVWYCQSILNIMYNNIFFAERDRQLHCIGQFRQNWLCSPNNILHCGI